MGGGGTARRIHPFARLGEACVVGAEVGVGIGEARGEEAVSLVELVARATEQPTSEESERSGPERVVVRDPDRGRRKRRKVDGFDVAEEGRLPRVEHADHVAGDQPAERVADDAKLCDPGGRIFGGDAGALGIDLLHDADGAFVDSVVRVRERFSVGARSEDDDLGLRACIAVAVRSSLSSGGMVGDRFDDVLDVLRSAPQAMKDGDEVDGCRPCGSHSGVQRGEKDGREKEGRRKSAASDAGDRKWRPRGSFVGSPWSLALR